MCVRSLRAGGDGDDMPEKPQSKNQRYYTVVRIVIRRGEGYDYKYGKCTGERTDQADEEKPRPGGCGRVYRRGAAHGGRADDDPAWQERIERVYLSESYAAKHKGEQDGLRRTSRVEIPCG